MGINLAGCDVVLARKGDVEVTLVVAKVEVDLTTVIKYENLAVSLGTTSDSDGCCCEENDILLWVHGSSIDIEVGVDLDG